MILDDFIARKRAGIRLPAFCGFGIVMSVVMSQGTRIESDTKMDHKNENTGARRKVCIPVCCTAVVWSQSYSPAKYPAKIEENAVLSIPFFAYPMLFGELDLRAQVEFLVRDFFKPTLHG